jgi:hypothetical protein
LAKAIKRFSGGRIDIHPLECRKIQKILKSYYGGSYKQDFFLIERDNENIRVYRGLYSVPKIIRNVAPKMEEYHLEPDLENTKALICMTQEGEQTNISIPYKRDDKQNSLFSVIVYGYIKTNGYSSARAVLTRHENNHSWKIYLIASSVNGEQVKLDDTRHIASHCGGCAATCYANSEECIEWDSQCLLQYGSLISLCRLTCTCCLSFWPCCPPCISCAMGDLYCRILCCKKYRHVCTKCTGVAC